MGMKGGERRRMFAPETGVRFREMGRPADYTCIDMMSEYACTILLRTCKVA